MTDTLKKSKLKTIEKKPNYKALYFISFAVFIVVFLVALVISRGGAAKCIFFYDTTDTFMDSLNSIIYNEADPYESNVIYPPLACLFYKALNSIIPLSDYYTFVSDPTILSQSDYLRVMQYYLFPFMLFMLFMGLLLLLSIEATLKGKKYEKFLFIITVFFSTPFLFAVERGNNLIIPLACSLFFIGFYDSENKILRELALIALAVATGFKLYPAMFAIVLLCEKKWYMFVRECVYCIITTILPFFIFYKGFHSLKLMFTSIIGFSSKKTSNLYNFDASLDFKHIVIYAYKVTQRFTRFDFDDTTVGYISDIAKYLLALVCGFAAILCKEKWKKSMFVAAIIYGFPGSCSTYLLLFFIIPIIFLFNDEKTRKVSTYIYLVLLFVTQIPIILPHKWAATRYIPTKLSSAAVGLICLMGFYEIIVNVIRLAKKEKEASK